MKMFPKALRDALAAPVTTIAECWRLTRADGAILGFTDHDGDLTFAGTRFEARSGLTASEAESEAGMASGTREIAGALSSARIHETDIASGRYDGAVVETFLVDWTNPEAAHARTDVQTIGEVRRGDLAFTAELRSRMAELNRVRGRLYRRACDASLGDGRCGIDLVEQGLRREASIVAGTVSSLDLAMPDTGSTDRYRFGKIMLRTGSAKGIEREIADMRANGEGILRVVLATPLPVMPAIGDEAIVTQGCDKRFATCRSRFGNGVNFRGFPHLPGNDAALGVAKSDVVHDGGPLVP